MYSNDMQEDDPWLPVRTVMEVGSRPTDGEERLGIAVLHARQYGCVGYCVKCFGYGKPCVHEYLQQSGIYIYTRIYHPRRTERLAKFLNSRSTVFIQVYRKCGHSSVVTSIQRS